MTIFIFFIIISTGIALRVPSILSSKIPTLYSFPGKYVSTRDERLCLVLISKTFFLKLEKL